MSTNSGPITAPVPSPVASGPRTLQVVTLVVAGAAAVLSVFAITARDAGTGTAAAVAVQSPAVSQAPIVQPTAGAGADLDDCGRPIVLGRFACR